MNPTLITMTTESKFQNGFVQIREEGGVPLTQMNPATIKMTRTKKTEKTPCPQCGKEFLCVNSHITKTHKRDMWRVIVPMDLEKDCVLLHYGKEVSRQPWCAGGEDVEGDKVYPWVEVYFYLEDEALRKELKMLGLWVTIPTTSDEDGVPTQDKARERVGWEGDGPTETQGWVPIDRLNWTIVYV